MKFLNGNAPLYKLLSSGDDVKRRLAAGVEALNKAVGSTMGPRGTNVALDNGPGTVPLVTNDGVTVAKAIDLEDTVENMAAQLIKDAAEKTNEYAGDGTTTATVLAARLFSEGLRHTMLGANPVLLKKGLDKVVKVAVDILRGHAIPVDLAGSDIQNIATISSQNPDVGAVLADLYRQMGPDAVLSIEDDPNILGVSGTFMEGLSWEGGLYSPNFCTDPIRGEAVYADIPVLLLDLNNVTAPGSLVKLMQTIYKELKTNNLLVVARNLNGGALLDCISNHLQGSFHTICAKTNVFGDTATAFMDDLAALTGATVVNESSGHKLPDLIDTSVLGRARLYTGSSSKSMLLALDDTTTKARIADRVAVIDAVLGEAKIEDARDKLVARKSKLLSGIGVVKVGTASSVEGMELKLRIEDAINATRAAVREGYVTGGGSALVHVANVLRNKDPEAWGLYTREEKAAFDILCTVLEEPARRIAINSGANPDTVVEQIYMNFENPTFGFNATTCAYEDLVAAGVLDPVLVTRSALENAVSVIGTLLTTGTTVTNSKEKIDPKA